jgi:hypothetical protein
MGRLCLRGRRRNAIILAIAADTMTIQNEGSSGTMDLPLASIKQAGPDGEFANGLSGLGGCSSSGSKKLRKRTKPALKTEQTYDWAIDKVTRLIVKPNVGPVTPVASRMFIVYESSFFIGEEWVPQEEAEIGLLEALNNELVRDFWVCAHLKFLRNLFHATPSECRVVRMLGRLEPVCLSETVEEHMASLEEQLEWEAIYAKYIEAQAALVAATAAAAAAAVAAAAAGFEM